MVASATQRSSPVRRGIKPAVDASPRYLGATTAIISVALTTWLLIYSFLLGSYGILLVYAIWFPRLVFKGRLTVVPSPGVVAVLALPIFAVISASWSDFPTVSLRAALEFVSIVLCVIIAARTVQAREVVLGILLGSMASLCVALASGDYGIDPFDGTYTLVGWMGSKNQVGFVASLGILMSCLMFFRLQVGLLWRVAAFLLLCIAGYALVQSRSTGSVFASFFTLALLFGVSVTVRVPAKARAAFAAAGLVLVAIVGIWTFASGASDMVLSSFGKDSSLTGRTYLWGEGINIGMDEPVVGHGYAGFWVPGQPQAERYWYEFYIPGSSGFHFHDTYIEAFVELGAVGAVTIALLVITSFLGSLVYALRNSANIESLFALGIASLFMIRAFVEVDLLGPFGVAPFLFYSILPRLEEASRKVSVPARR